MDELDRAGTAVLASPPAEPTPIDALRPRVRRRVQRRRALITVGVVSVLAIPAIGFGLGARSDRGSVGLHTINTDAPRPTTPVTTAKRPVARTLPPGSRVDPDDVMTMSFADAQHGFATYATIGSLTGLAATTDGGVSWRALAAVPKNLTLDFTSVHDGWAYGAYGRDRFVTHDGGRTWTDTHPGGDVDALDAIGSSVWSLVGCTATSVPCVDQLERSDDGGHTWQSTALPGMPAGAAALDRIDSAHAFVWSAFNSGAFAPAIIATSDGGATWRARANPCGPLLASIAGVNAFDLWASCSGSGSATTQKELFRSPDGGATWVLTARVGLQPAPDLGRLPEKGYGADLIAINDQVAILTSGRGTVSVSTDAGRTWSVAVELGEFLGTITRLRGSDTVWVGSAHTCGQQCGVWRATDGIHFHFIAVGTPY